ncbi:hypothetical protein MYA_5423 [Burkholderia sp. KJ006]|nr:hypothetical protein MYA_5423 [Burkholderia sp. KJ006]
MKKQIFWAVLIASVCCCIAIALFEPACARRFSGNDIGRIR